MIGFTKLGYRGFLGNQLFQYALLKGVAAKKNYEIAIPKRYKFIPEQTARNEMGWVQLEYFNINCKELPENHNFSNDYKEQDFSFNENVFSVEDDTDFDGYFQSYKYFEHIEEQIKNEFIFKPDVNLMAENFINQLRKKILLLCMSPKDIINLHVRRGTYLNYPHTQTHHIVNINYYNKAMELFHKNVIFLIFSDDIQWCKQKFKGNQFAFCETSHLTKPLGERGPHQGGNHWLDMAIMSKCDGHIIAASTFSWWGAWLCNSKNKKVIAPQEWFGPAFSHFNTSDLIPKEWIRI